VLTAARSEAGNNPALSRNCEAPTNGDEPGRLRRSRTSALEDGRLAGGARRRDLPAEANHLADRRTIMIERSEIIIRLGEAGARAERADRRRGRTERSEVRA
jgi:hypothetical protein